MRSVSEERSASITGTQVLSRLNCAMPHLRHALVPDRPLQPFSLDSLDFVEFLCVVESEFAVQLGESDLESSLNVGALADLIAARAPSHSIARINP